MNADVSIEGGRGNGYWGSRRTCDNTPLVHQCADNYHVKFLGKFGSVDLTEAEGFEGQDGLVLEVTATIERAPEVYVVEYGRDQISFAR